MVHLTGIEIELDIIWVNMEKYSNQFKGTQSDTAQTLLDENIHYQQKRSHAFRRLLTFVRRP